MKKTGFGFFFILEGVVSTMCRLILLFGGKYVEFQKFLCSLQLTNIVSKKTFIYI